MKKRVYTSIAIVITLALLFVLKVFVSDYFFDAFFAIVACLAAFEMSRLFTKTGRFNHVYVASAFPLLLLAGNLVGIHFVSVTKDLYWVLYTILIDLGLALFVALGMFLLDICTRKRTKNEISVRGLNVSTPKFALKKAFNTFICFIYPAFLFLFFNLINHFGELPLGRLSETKDNLSIFVLITAIIIPMITDTFAMLMGSLIGGKKLCPKISPGKTISGAIGGALWAVLIAACVYFVFGCIESFQAFLNVFPIWAYLLIVLFGSCVAQASDIFESLLKRRAGVKDSGKILSGHGGMLDRIDSYIFIAPFILLTFWLFLI